MLHVNMFVFLLLAVSLLLPSCSDGSRCCKQEIPKLCDYIVVGAGAGGIPVAARLSEDPDVNVCLFEAGPTDRRNVGVQTPRMWTGIGFYPGEINWNHTTVPQKGLKNKVKFTGMARILGGSTSHNAMLYFRGFKNDFDSWAAKGAKGWSYRDVLPYYSKFENLEVPNTTPSDECGPLTVTQDPEIKETPMYKVFEGTAKQMNIPVVQCNEPNPSGLCITQGTVELGQRVSTSTAYLQPIMGRRNLFIITDALVEKILISRRDNKAYGIKVTSNGQTRVVKAKNEVIISAGAIETPKLLQLSGIGPKNVLRRLKIRPHKILPVGDNYHTHTIFLLDLSVDVPTPIISSLSDPNVLADYVFRRKGIYSGSGVDYHLFLDVIKQGRFNYPEAQLLIGNSKTSFSITDQNLITGQPPMYGFPGRQNGSHFGIFLARPKSRGVIRAFSRNPRQQPLIDPNIFGDEDDIRTSIKVIRVLQEMMKTPAMKMVNAEFSTFLPITDDCKSLMADSDEQWECILRNQVGPIQHPVGTCKMGSPKDPTTVVDPFLRVKGIRGLRVADASVMPETTTSNTMAPSIMIGERAADFIKSQRLKTKITS